MRILVVITILLALKCTAACAQESAKPWYNPFAKSTGSDVQQSSFFNKKSSSASFKMPQLKLPSMGGSRKSNGPSTLTKMSRSTKKMWNSTVDFLNPFDSPAPPKNQQPWYQPQSAQKKADAGGWKWPWSPQEEPSEPIDVGGFLKQPRPQF